MEIYLKGITNQQLEAVDTLSDLLGIELKDTGHPILVKKSERSYISLDSNEGRIEYNTDVQFIRNIGILVENMKRKKCFQVEEKPVYDSLGVMFDCSRNGVMTIHALKKMVRYLALMGYSSIQLYTEDTFKLEAYPYVGYLRGAYSIEELKEMDKYAQLFGIELIPCIQTLGHLGQVLKWNAYEHMVDTNDILLVDNEATYEFIEEVFKLMSKSLSSRKINIGMDEAHMIGLGKFLECNGYQDRISIMMRHLNRVLEIANKYDYKPMMWSDMFFRLIAKGKYENYDDTDPFDKKLNNCIPDNLSLVYWDYYSNDRKKYDLMLKKHKQMTDRVLFAGGAWKWTSFNPNNQFSMDNLAVAHESCIEHQVKDTFITSWGDNGAEASIYSILPTMQFWAELCYTNNKDYDYISKRFKTCTSGIYDDFLKMDNLNYVPDNKKPGKCAVNPTKYILYQDILYGLFDKHIDSVGFEKHFNQCKKEMEECMRKANQWHYLFDTQYWLSKILETKCSAGIKLREAYKNDNRQLLEDYTNILLPELKEACYQFIECYKRQWQKENKIFGLDVFDIRLGGLIQRIDTAIQRINDYLNNHISQIEELEETILYYDGKQDEKEHMSISEPCWHRICTPSTIM